MNNTHTPFDAETWEQLPGFFDKLPQAVHLHYWGIEDASDGERETAVLCRTLADHFDNINLKQFSRRKNYNFWPVLGVMGDDDGQPVDYGVRIIGWPNGYQLTSLITAIQVVAFQAQTLEPLTRIQLAQLPAEVNIEVLSAADDEGGALVAKIAFGLAVANEKVKSYLIMADEFPEALIRHSAYTLPHTVVNGRVHIEGVIDEPIIMKQIAQAIKSNQNK
jgi:alkyl hydroperoxide reductase subunit AhpF